MKEHQSKNSVNANHQPIPARRRFLKRATARTWRSKHLWQTPSWASVFIFFCSLLPSAFFPSGSLCSSVHPNLDSDIMDPTSALAVISSLLAFTSSTLVIAQVITRGNANTKSLTEELEVIELILTECIQSLDSHANTGNIPPSIERCLVLCDRKRSDAIEIMEKIHGKTGEKRSPFTKAVRFAFLSVTYEQPLIARFNSFRDTAMLLRDLTSEYAPRQSSSAGARC